jgi:hypothetical protein
VISNLKHGGSEKAEGDKDLLDGYRNSEREVMSNK